MINVRIPLYTYGTAISHVNLDQIEESPQKCTQILLNDSQYNIYLCNFTQLCRNLLVNKNLILFIQYEELIQFDDKLQNIFDIIQFAQVKKVMCCIIQTDSIKRCQWKIDIVKKYIEISTQKFKLHNFSQPNYNIQSIQSQQNIFNQLNFFYNTPKDPDFYKENDTLMQILSRNKNELEVALIQGIVILSDVCYFENSTANNKPFQIIEIEGKLNYRNSDVDRQIFRIKISDDTELKDQNFISNNPIQVKQIQPQIIFNPLFDSSEQTQKFYLNYRNTQDLSVIIGGEQYDIKNLEFVPFKSGSKLGLQLANSKVLCTEQFDKKDSLKINSQLILINKTNEDIIAFGQVEQDNFEITFAQNQNKKTEQQEIEQFYLPLNDEDIIHNVQRGEQQQKGNHIVKCRICMEDFSNTLLIPCGHVRYCLNCSGDIQQCLFCEANIISKKKLIIKYIEKDKNKLLQNLMCKHQDLLQFSLQQNINTEQNLKINALQKEINFYQYYCQICNKSKGTEFVNCEQNHLYNSCEECSKQLKECEYKGCKKNILHKGKVIYNFASDVFIN